MTVRTLICDFVAEFWQREGYAPSIAETAEAMALSPNAVRYHLAALVREGRITYEPGKHRTVRVATP